MKKKDHDKLRSLRVDNSALNIPPVEVMRSTKDWYGLLVVLVNFNEYKNETSKVAEKTENRFYINDKSWHSKRNKINLY